MWVKRNTDLSQPQVAKLWYSNLLIYRIFYFWQTNLNISLQLNMFNVHYSNASHSKMTTLRSQWEQWLLSIVLIVQNVQNERLYYCLIAVVVVVGAMQSHIPLSSMCFVFYEMQLQMCLPSDVRLIAFDAAYVPVANKLSTVSDLRIYFNDIIDRIIQFM